MLRVNQLSGFGGGALGPIISTGVATNTNNPTFTVNLGLPGVKQVFCAFAAADTNGSDFWLWGTGSIGGEAFTYAVGSGEETSGNGGAFTGGATIRALQTSLYGEQTVSMPLSVTGIPPTARDKIGMLAIVLRGFSTSVISYDGGDNFSGSDGNDFTISTVGARLVIGAAAASTAPGDFQGPGSEVTAFTDANIALGYDFAPAGTTGNVYSFTGDKYIIAGASFG